MKFSENWLRTFVNPSLSSDELAHALTMAGLEVEALESVAPAFDKVVVAEVVSLEKHPNADRLNVCQVNVGQNMHLQIVCGAQNVFAGARVPCALVGAKLPGLEIRQAKLRNVDSFGMLCSPKELGLAQEADGLLILPADAPVGLDIRAYLELDDKLFTLKLTPNRSDCLSVMGVAREVAAITASSLKFPAVEAVVADVADRFDVKVSEPAACPRYCGRVIKGVNAKAATPRSLVQRLERSGLRSISPIVDVTNYVMLEMGQPLHAFDLAKLKGGIEVRLARRGEKLKLLNGQEADLEPDMLAICDASGPLALAGVMGGEGSGVNDDTVDIFLESAYFNPDAIAGRPRRLGVSSDSSYRFERGVDFAATRECLERASQLIIGICGGQAGPVTEVQNALPARDPIALRVARANKVLGLNLDEETVGTLLRRLQFSFGEQRGVYYVTPPSYRFDLSIEEDLIEELARMHGYDNVPAATPRAAMSMLPVLETERSEAILRNLMVSRDYQEVITYSFVEESWERDFAGNAQPQRLKNPIASQMGVMRSTLIGSLVDVLRVNLARKQERVRIFELGRCFVTEGQPCRISGLCHGMARAEQWGEPGRQVDFFDGKADVEALLAPLGARFEVAAHPALHPGQSARVMLDGVVIGWLGALHPRWVQQYELGQAPIVFELDLPPLLERKVPRFKEISKFPPVRRDLAGLVDEAVPVRDLLEEVRKNLPASALEFELFDVYRGKGIDLGKKSLAFRLFLQDTHKTLTDAEVDQVVSTVLDTLKSKFGFELRS